MEKKILKLAAIMLFLAGGLVSCGDRNEQNKIPFIEIGKGNLSGNEGISKQSIVIDTQEDWISLKLAVDSINNVTKSFDEQNIDFDKYRIIAVFGEIYPSGNWSIRVESLTEHTDRIVIAVAAQNHDNETSPQWITQPYHIVKIPVTTKKIEFE